MTADDPGRRPDAASAGALPGVDPDIPAATRLLDDAEPSHAHDHRAGTDGSEGGDEGDAGDPTGFDAPMRRGGLPTRAALAIVRGYKLAVSPLMPPACRFVPTCSEYGYEAVAKYGIIKGGRLAIWRILRCNPFGRGGYDPVP